jgi:hypothetical protein
VADLARILALLSHAYPGTVEPATRAVYERALGDLDPEEVETAVMSLIALRPRLPAVSEIRAAVFERRLALPSPLEAWLAANELAFAPPAFETCPECGGRGLLHGDDPEAAEECRRCAAEGKVRVRRPAPPLVREAMGALGGATAITAADKQEVIRAQFLKAYEALRRRALEDANLASAGLTRRDQPALERGPRT